MICIAGRDTLSASSQGPGLSKGPSIDRSLQQPPRKSQPKTKKGRGRRRRFLDRADTGKRDRREYREPYSEEQAMWLWFFRIDVRMPWKKVIAKYTIDWPLDQRKLTGTQCKFYRLATQYGFPKSRQRKGSPEEVAHRWGMWPMMRRSYAWMEEHRHMLQGKSTLNTTTHSRRLMRVQAMWEAALTMDQHNIIDRSTASRFVSTAGSHEARLA